MATPRLKEKYKSEIVPALEKQLEIDNINKVPRLSKIVVNMGVGAAAGDAKLLDAAVADMRVITGQQPDKIVKEAYYATALALLGDQATHEKSTLYLQESDRIL